MANIKNWQPEMTAEEKAWFDKCPKSVLFEIARQLAALAAGEENADKAFNRMREEWSVLHIGGLVPQKPLDLEKHNAKLKSARAKKKAFSQQFPNGWCARDHLK